MKPGGEKAPKRLLVVGTGSVGKRHLRNFSALGARVWAVDPRSDRLEEAAAETTLIGRYTSLEAALAAREEFDAAVICSPPAAHVEQALKCLELRLPCLIEKPLGTDVAAARRLLEPTCESPHSILGYTYRWWQPLQDMRQALAANEIGTPRHVRCVMSAHLADWHPWEPYQAFFMASSALGGGALLDESHFLDIILWYFGLPTDVYAQVEHLSELEIDTDDNVDALLRYESGLRVSIHLDLYGRPHAKSIDITGEKGTLSWSFEPNELRLGQEALPSWQTRSYTLERNDMFLQLAREFLAVLDGTARPTCTFRDGYEVLRVIEAMRRSSSSGRVVRMEDVS